MNQELDARKGFLLVTAFVLVLLVGFNFDRFSGEAVRKGTPDTTVTVKPDVVRASESVTVRTFTPKNRTSVSLVPNVPNLWVCLLFEDAGLTKGPAGHNLADTFVLNFQWHPQYALMVPA